MSWDYAEMSKTAKQLGGPEKYADYVYNSGKMCGLSEGRCQGALAGTVVGMAVSWLISKAYEKYKEKKLKKVNMDMKYKEQLIRAMEEKADAELDTYLCGNCSEESIEQ